MSTSTTSSAEISAISSSSISIPKSGMTGKLIMVVFTLGVVAAMIMAIIWIRERPIRQAEQLLEDGLRNQAVALAEGREPDDSQISEAYHTISQYLESQPHDSRALALQARILLHVNRPEEALEVFKRVGPNTIEELQDYARCYIAMENYEAALPLIEEVLRQEPSYSDALYEASTCRVKLGRFPEALESAKLYAEQPGNEAKGHLLVASIQNELMNLPATIEAYEKVLEYSPDAQGLGIPSWQFFYLLGSAYHSNRQPDKALQMLERSLELNRHPDIYTRMGESYMDSGEPQKAETAWRMAIEVAPTHTRALEQLANREIQRGNGAEALKILKPLEEVVTTSTLAYSFQQAYTQVEDKEKVEFWRNKAERLRRVESRVRVINEVLRNQPESLWGLALRSHRFAAIGNWDMAEQLFRPIRLDEQSHQFLKELAVALEQRKDELLPALELLPIELNE